MLGENVKPKLSGAQERFRLQYLSTDLRCFPNSSACSAEQTYQLKRTQLAFSTASGGEENLSTCRHNMRARRLTTPPIQYDYVKPNVLHALRLLLSARSQTSMGWSKEKITNSKHMNRKVKRVSTGIIVRHSTFATDWNELHIIAHTMSQNLGN